MIYEKNYLVRRSFLHGVKNSQPEVFCKTGAFKNFSKFTGKHLYQSLFLIKAEA